MDLLEVIHYRVKEGPTKVLYTLGENSITYKEAWEYSNSVASALKSRGVTSKDQIPIIGDKECEYIIGILACLKIGCSFIPLSVTSPRDSLLRFFEFESPSFLLYCGPLSDKKNYLGCQYININELLNISNQETINRARAEPEELFVSFFADNYSGKVLKSSMKISEFLFSLTQLEKNLCNHTDDKNFLLQLSLSSPLGLYFLLVALIRGGKVCALSDKEQGDFNILVDRLFVYSDEVDFCAIDKDFLYALTSSSKTVKKQCDEIKKFVICGDYLGLKNLDAYRSLIKKSKVTGVFCHLLSPKQLVYSNEKNDEVLIGNINEEKFKYELESHLKSSYENNFFHNHLYLNLEDLEKAYLEIPYIESSCLILMNERSFVSGLCAFLVLSKEESESFSPSILKKRIREDLSEKLPHAFLPSVVYLLDELPKNDQNQIDRSLLTSMI